MNFEIKTISEPEIIGFSDGSGWRRIDYIRYQINNQFSLKIKTVVPHESIIDKNLYLDFFENFSNSFNYIYFKYIFQPEDLICVDEKGIIGKVNYKKIYRIGDVVAKIYEH